MTRRNMGLSGNELATAVGVTPNRRADWARKGLLRPAPGPFGPLDAVDLACLGAMVDKVGPKAAKRCWPSVRQALRDRLPGRQARLWAVIDARPIPVRLLTTTSAVATAVSQAPGAVTVLAIHELAEAALEAFREATPEPVADHATAAVEDLASRRRAPAS